MELNSNCVRDILIAVENCDFGERLTLDKLHTLLPSYSINTLWYTCLKLQEGGFLKLMTIHVIRQPMPTIKQIEELTYSGHEFLNTIRSDTNWGKVKNIAQKAGVFSLKALGEIAQSVASAAITAALQPRP